MRTSVSSCLRAEVDPAASLEDGPVHHRGHQLSSTRVHANIAPRGRCRATASQFQVSTRGAHVQGLTLVHFSAHPEPFVTQTTT